MAAAAGGGGAAGGGFAATRAGAASQRGATPADRGTPARYEINELRKQISDLALERDVLMRSLALGARGSAE
ncbi:hypothetical protein [Mycobacterium sp. pR1184]|uniref:hypothetical protein n=1 Tax=Mycobacterium sp. pR1184 TaxID=3238981 RepID=UPI00351B0C0B